MSDLGRLIFLPEQVRELDRIAIAKLGIKGYELMSRAGRVVFDLGRQRYPDAGRWLILCGGGNNGGDGYVVARLAVQAGLSVKVVALAEPAQLQGDAALAFKDFAAGGGRVQPLSAAMCDEAELVVDAMLGTGLTRSVQGSYLAGIQAVNGAACPVLAVDLPSGLHGATGEAMGAAVCADLTATFIGRKLGLYVGNGPDLAGEIVYANLGVPHNAAGGLLPAATLFERSDLTRLLPRRPRTSHKGDFGHALVIGGSHGMGGAVRLAAEAALRAGAGLVTVATRPENVAAVTGYRPELMCRGVQSAADLDEPLSRASVIAIGPGLGQDAWAADLLRAALARSQPKVVDADALNLLALEPRRDARWILTPHPGEAARLLATTTSGIQADRLTATRRLSARYGGAALLKGRCTLIAAEGAVPIVVDRGNPGMASAGMGDVLTGLIAGLVSQQPDGELSSLAAAAAFIHGSAGDAAAIAGERGLIAGDVLLQLRPWLNPPP